MPRVVCKTEQLTCLDVSSSAEGRWGKVYLLWVAKQLVYLKHRYLTEVVLWLYVMVTFWFQATQGASFAHGWRNFGPPRFAPHPISPPSPKRRGSHPFVSPNSHEEDHIHSCCTSLTLPSEDGESRQKPRPVVEKDDPSVLHMSACLILIFRLRTCQWCRLSAVACFSLHGGSTTAYGEFLYFTIYNSIWLVVHSFLLSVLHVYVYGATVAGVVVLCGRCGCLCPC